MCRESGVPQSSVAGLKSGSTKQLSAGNLKKLSEYFGISINSIISEQKEKPSETGELAEFLEDLRTRPETRALLEASRGMTKEQIEKMADFAKTLRGTD